MAIGEFASALRLPRQGDVGLSTPLYWMYEMGYAALNPSRAMADASRAVLNNPINPVSHTTLGKSMAAACELFERTTRRYGKPDWGITHTVANGQSVPVHVNTVWRRPFCNLLHFERAFEYPPRQPQPRLLIVAPVSGHHATLLRGTVEAMLPTHDVYVTDWVDAKLVPLTEGRFSLSDYVDYLISIFHRMGGDCHVMAVCQPAVPVMMAVARMEAEEDPFVPKSMILMGGPIDTREAPTAVNAMAKDRGIDWFKRTVLTTVPWSHPGAMREVYPGFLQLNGFMSMNMDRHLQAHWDLFHHLVQGDGDSAEKHRDFYDEYLAVMDLTAEFYIETVENVFITHALPKGEIMHHSQVVKPDAIHRVALMTVEGEKDDISGIGQTKAAHKICPRIPEDKRAHYEQPGVGHYGVFNGSRFRSEIAPRIADFILSQELPRGATAQAPTARPAAEAVEDGPDVFALNNKVTAFYPRVAPT
ncbi:UNVERIFIED_ORG: poly(3-hydroxybutyrate) depolymerase [Xanthobacter viscosus]|uniref:Polyhydroxyalkanoate depolymerase n=1 Tax=Xanthobacter autotrophicus TaxID=280 RepID=A0A6C1KT96_XANAU|nr:polyhydroxyalkanoate depolymerase [Xanthobacter autotrophicus]TLX42093.1 polyhydroxyalkanoate depolymerase [Xanthobacter autotrophicus]